MKKIVCDYLSGITERHLNAAIIRSMIKLTTLFTFLMLLQSMVHSEDTYPGFFPSSDNITQLKQEIQERFMEFSEMQKSISPASLMRPSFNRAFTGVRDGLIKLKKLLADREFIKAHRLLFDLQSKFNILRFISNPENHLFISRNSLVGYKDSVCLKLQHIRSQKKLNFNELNEALKKITSLERKLLAGKLHGDEFKLLDDLLKAYLIRYDYYKEMSDAKQQLAEAGKLQQKINSAWSQCRELKKNPNIDLFVKQCYSQLLDCEDLYRKSEFQACLKQLEILARNQAIADQYISAIIKGMQTRKK